MAARKRKRSKLIWLLVALLLIGGAGYWVKDNYFTEEPPEIMTSPVTRGDIEKTVLATGILKPAKLVAVGAQVSGRVTSLDVGVGDSVKEGDLIAEIDSETQENDLRTAEASLANVRAQKEEKQATLVQAEQALARQTRMINQNAVSRADYEEAEATVKVTKAQISALDAQIAEAEVAVETAKVDLGYTKITAPMDGTVLWVVTQEGQTVNAIQSAPTIVILGQLDTMTVRAEISEVDVVDVKPGQPVYFTVLGNPDRRYESTLSFIEPAPESITSDSMVASSSSSSSSASEKAIYYNGIFEVPNQDRELRTYMTAEVHIVLGQAHDVLTLPSAALGSKDADGKYSVNVLEPDGNVAERKVEIGLNDKIRAEVVSGLSEGDRVVMGQPGSSESGRRRGRRGPMGF
ncbi:efflux RND transporter periplasmic adaptor subunit [Afifella marina]|uniref:Membrane fusion protein, macrolide-specific efflux system n=1 Tax=Afifella marina DSM 2698 TaxID=1120955 RepID=A0A1G5P135_AFIMA|nr:efflux RND transporter periplasmic adaptor subunit [Afifella marina]MBK1624302.1 efflux RND transporter periplasmic adaptor subunit [Afifella marina DSM 2698]MBK1628035.1 efflux RND transporter periplasmic adaptor subunit [Afifella marina]MBK5918229.1 efflux transporter periplasmic adaptor subunit [Afifella marina]RAI19267.1 efflux transporter periplasmic adaptor subunit [Afifella marina DSM 2698]SCZ43245.1 membrane fusion protein, macrolide-specific efflux system [Afifella marina DSM 2698]